MNKSSTVACPEKKLDVAVRPAEIHPTAIIDPSAKIHHTAKVGPFCIVDKDVEIGPGCHLLSHVVIRGDTKIGKNNTFYQFATIGEIPPDKKYCGEKTKLIIGDNNIFREAVTVHIGTIQDHGETIIGNGNLLMAYVHIAHDCVVGNHNVFSNNTSLAGHAKIGSNVTCGGFVKIAQHCQIGDSAFIAGDAGIVKDVPAFICVAASPARPAGLNRVGLSRSNTPTESQKVLQQAYQLTYQKNLIFKETIQALHELPEDMHGFLNRYIKSLESSERGILR